MDAFYFIHTRLVNDSLLELHVIRIVYKIMQCNKDVCRLALINIILCILQSVNQSVSGLQLINQSICSFNIENV